VPVTGLRPCGQGSRNVCLSGHALDFLAGPLARWDYKKKLVPGRGKYVDLLQGAVADNPYLVVLLSSQWDGGIGVGRLLTSKTPFSDFRQAGR
jgi:hypothetical protein